MGAPIPTLRETGSNKQYFNSIIESCVGLQALIVLSYNSQLRACGDCPPLETSILLRPKLIPVRYRKAVLVCFYWHGGRDRFGDAGKSRRDHWVVERSH